MDILDLSDSTKTVLILIAGIGLAVYGGYSLMQQNSALQNAEQINVTIESTGVDRVSQRRGVEYEPKASFNYTYNGESHTSDNLYPSGIAQEFNSEEDASQVIEGYETGETVTGNINPESPGNAFLLDEKSNSPYFMIVIGVLMAVIGIGSKFQG
ncbi:MAG: DUF3592 domain-containing protein [Nanohaloarchaea archaeon]|nr:DUF3592 domain-containing protein [Candidatus Nanohaloarchaea archaeon]